MNLKKPYAARNYLRASSIATATAELDGIRIFYIFLFFTYCFGVMPTRDRNTLQKYAASKK